MTAPTIVLVCFLAQAGTDRLQVASDTLNYTHASATMVHQLDHVLRHNTDLPGFLPLLSLGPLMIGMQLVDVGPLVWIPFDLVALLLDVTAHYGSTEIDPVAHLYEGWAEGHNALGVRSPVLGRLAQGTIALSVISGALHLVTMIIEGVRYGFTALRRRQVQEDALIPAVSLVPMESGSAVTALWRF
jgi:hypothetical protein